jgi:hypothetical protein
LDFSVSAAEESSFESSCSMGEEGSSSPSGEYLVRPSPSPATTLSWELSAGLPMTTASSEFRAGKVESESSTLRLLRSDTDSELREFAFE